RHWEDYTDVWHTGPGTLAGEYLRTFWQPVYRAQDLAPGQAVPIELMSERLTLYRGQSGVPYVVDFRCAHRRTQLSTGWVEGDSLRCRYHGWKYDGTGQCVEQPGELESFAAKVRIASYPTQEYLGLIFAYLAQGEPPPMQRHPDFEGPGILDLEEPEYWPCNYFNRIDNACDIAHVLYTHYEALQRAERNGTPGGIDSYAGRTFWSQETSYGIRTAVQHPGEPPRYFRFQMPNANQNSDAVALHRTGVDSSSKAGGKRISWRVPVNDELTASFSVNLLNTTEEEVEAYRQLRQRIHQLAEGSTPPHVADAILAGRMREEDLPPETPRAFLFSVEDYVTQVGQGQPEKRGPDRLGRIDEGVIFLRSIWQRELKAFAEGEPVKHWTPHDLLNGEVD
ncbi:MAG: Rieske 2Fe-2S domain-containing protein, partial [Chloroflexi bacterium]|nr:Rieske 2Fe-2S domain-containing protein [Chloroflexota bacterium]